MMLPLSIDPVVPTQVVEMDNSQKGRWRVRDSVFSAWRDLPTEYRGSEIWEMLQRGIFSAAMPKSETGADPKEVSDR